MDAAYVVSPDGKLPWELEESSTKVEGYKAAPAVQDAPRTGGLALVQAAERGSVEELQRLLPGANPNLLAAELRLYQGSFRMFSTDWTPLTAATFAGKEDAVKVLLEASADVNEVCCCCTSSGPYSFWTALDIARAGETLPCERDPQKQKQPRHPTIEKLLLSFGAKPGSKLPEPPGMNTYGALAEENQRQNPCLDEHTGFPLRPSHLYSEEEELQRQQAPGAPKFSSHRGGGGCPMTSMGMLATSQPEGGPRIYSAVTATKR
ncbi:unnamed protein product [Cladocopium goreaui]|uniref:Cathepsin B-like cysteine proteinase 5 n=1 Tax=Cladocopium goreaui TaxID=2562237 RepID=A0A9P1CBZ1_9DINO|nr:unnamed protein product [Cladocopium goreaui]